MKDGTRGREKCDIPRIPFLTVIIITLHFPARNAIIRTMDGSPEKAHPMPPLLCCDTAPRQALECPSVANATSDELFVKIVSIVRCHPPIDNNNKQQRM